MCTGKCYSNGQSQTRGTANGREELYVYFTSITGKYYCLEDFRLL